MQEISSAAPSVDTGSKLQLSAEQVLLIRQAIEGLTLCHSQAPETLAKSRQITTCVGSEDGHTYEIVSARQTGRTVEYLLKFFQQDQKDGLKYDKREFDHEFIDTEAADDFGVPMFCHTLNISPKTFLESGHQGDDKGAQYCLFARNEQGRIAGFISFSLNLNAFENVFGAVDDDGEDIAQLDWEDARRFYLNIDFKCIYTRVRFRGRGVGSALITAMDEIIQAEIHHLSEQLLPAFVTTGVPFKMQPFIYSEWNSRSGEMAHWKFLEELEGTCEFHRHLADTAEPSRKSLQILELDDGDSGY